MNDLLADVKTSQGIRVRLQWDLRDDAGHDVHDAVGLLGRARGSLTPEESTRLRDTLGGLIEAATRQRTRAGYTEHLARALDYRRWSAFAVRLQRPGTDGWTTLTRRTPLSQGEQKVVCYLPLFAAAAAHFTSVAGAAPYAPRLILLDDAFPKIDVRTHPLLFGLLVDLDLDFVLTSERLWGDPDRAVAGDLRGAAGARGARHRAVPLHLGRARRWSGRMTLPDWVADLALLRCGSGCGPRWSGARDDAAHRPRPCHPSCPRPVSSAGRVTGDVHARARGGRACWRAAPA